MKITTRSFRATLAAAIVLIALNACSARRTVLNGNNQNAASCSSAIYGTQIVARSASSGAAVQAVAVGDSVQWSLTLPTSCTGVFTAARLDSNGASLGNIQFSTLTSFTATYNTAGTVTERVTLAPVDGSFPAVTLQASLTVGGSSGSGIVCSVSPAAATIDVPLDTGGPTGSPFPMVPFTVSTSPAAHVVSVTLVEDPAKLNMNTFSGADLSTQVISGVISRTGTSNLRVVVANSSGQTTCPNAPVTLNPTANAKPLVFLTANGQSGNPRFSDGTVVTVAWQSMYATSCVLSPSSVFNSSVATSGSVSVTVNRNYSLSATCTGAGGSTAVTLTITDESANPSGIYCSAVAQPSTLFMPVAQNPFTPLPVKFLITTSAPTQIMLAQSKTALGPNTGFAFATPLPAGPGANPLEIRINATANAPVRSVATFYAMGPNGNPIQCDDAVWEPSTTVPTSTAAPQAIVTANGVAGSIPRPANPSAMVEIVWNSNAIGCTLEIPEPTDAQVPYPTPGMSVGPSGKFSLRADQIHGTADFGVACVASGGAIRHEKVTIDASSYPQPSCNIVQTGSGPAAAGQPIPLRLDLGPGVDYAIFGSDKVLTTGFLKSVGPFSAGTQNLTATAFGPAGVQSCSLALTVVNATVCQVNKAFNVFTSNASTYSDTWGSTDFYLPTDASEIAMRITRWDVDDYYPRFRVNGTTIMTTKCYPDNTYTGTPWGQQQYSECGNKAGNVDFNIAALLHPGTNNMSGTAYNHGGPGALNVRMVGSYKTFGTCTF